MRPFSTSEIIDLWEGGELLHPLDRSLLALSATLTSSSEDCADWPLGRRNRALFELHASCFGSRLQAWSSCPRCGENVEFEVDGGLLMTASEQAPPGMSIMIRGERFRLPTSRDLAGVLADDPDTAALRLLERCRLGDMSGVQWDNDAVSEAGEALAAADPLAETQLALNCPSCAHEWNDGLDVGSFVWAEIESRASRLLWEVHTLASAYGWTEADTLAVSAVRRANYLRMVKA